MVTRLKATSTIHLFLPVLVLCGLITSCALTLVSPIDPNSSLIIGRVVIDNKYSGNQGALPLGVVDVGIEVEVESRDESQYFKVTTEKQGYFFIPNIPQNTYQVSGAWFEGVFGSGKHDDWDRYRIGLRRLNFTPAPGKIIYIGSLFVELSERAVKKVREARENEKAKAYFLQKHGDSMWASREFIPTH